MKLSLGVFKWSILVSLVALVVAYFYGGWAALGLTAILGVMEISLSFDNAVVNARVLEKMSRFWQQIFLTIGMVIAVVGMRLAFPLTIVSVTTGLSFGDAISLALAKGDPQVPGTFGHYLHDAHPQIAAFGTMFLLLLFLEWVFEQREIVWLSWLEKPLAKVGQLDALAYLVALGALVTGALTLAPNPLPVFISGVFGIMAYIAVNGLGALFEGSEEGIHGDADDLAPARSSNVKQLVGKAAFFSFIYLEVLDSSFSFDGAIGAFAITADPIIIALGLGIIGALFVRSLTVFLVRQGTLNDYVYLDHGAHWAIGALAVTLLVSIGVDIPEYVTGLIGVVLIAAAFISSVVRNKRAAALDAASTPDEAPTPEPATV